jgi:hypothetical protein
VSILACAALLATFQRSASSQAPSDRRFIGTWRLVSIDSERPNPNRGTRPTGLIYYDTTGHMAAQISPGRSRPSWPPNTAPSPEQAKDAVAGYTAYFGTYVVNEHAGTVTHHREGALNMYAVDLVRKYEFRRDGRLVLTPLESQNSGITLVWERIP